VSAGSPSVGEHLEGLAESLATRAAARGASHAGGPPAAGAAAGPAAAAPAPAALGPIPGDLAPIRGLTDSEAVGLAALLAGRTATRGMSAAAAAVPGPLAEHYRNATAVAGPAAGPPDLHPGLSTLLVAQGKVKHHMGGTAPETLGLGKDIGGPVPVAAEKLGEIDVFAAAVVIEVFRCIKERVLSGKPAKAQASTLLHGSQLDQF
jgi:hypothetical protein